MTHPLDFGGAPTVVLTRPSRVGDRIVARGTVNPNAAVFAGHYPGLPILPAFYPIDCVARLLRAAYPDEARTGVLVAIDRARFRGPIVPNDELVLEVTPGPDDDCTATISTPRGVAQRLALRYRPETTGSQPDTEPDGGSSRGRTTTMGVGAIRNVLPHRFPCLLLDRVTGFAQDRWLTANKAVTCTEPWFAPTGPEPASHEDTLPPLITLVSWLQAAEMLVLTGRPDPDGARRIPLLGALNGACLLGTARPGDVLDHQVRLVRTFDNAAVVSGTTTVAGARVFTVDRAIIGFGESPVSNRKEPRHDHTRRHP